MELARAHCGSDRRLSRICVILFKRKGKPWSGTLKIGLCWATGPWRPQRSIPLKMLAPVADIAGVTLHNLQRGPAMSEMSGVRSLRFVNGRDTSLRIMDTARLLHRLDLVVTVHSMIAHLAGAMDVPVWLLLDAQPDWRWRSGARGSVRYSGVRKYQQTTPGEWGVPLAELLRDLERRARANIPVSIAAQFA